VFDIPFVDVWSLEELGTQVGNIDRTAALKALVTWVDMGVLKEDTEGSFRLLEIAEEPAPGAKTISRPGNRIPSDRLLDGITF
jgi:anaphase-promoting complex subunit 2